LEFTIESLIFNDKSYIIYLVDLIKQLWEYNSSNISKVTTPLKNQTPFGVFFMVHSEGGFNQSVKYKDKINY